MSWLIKAWSWLKIKFNHFFRDKQPDTPRGSAVFGDSPTPTASAVEPENSVVVDKISELQALIKKVEIFFEDAQSKNAAAETKIKILIQKANNFHNEIEGARLSSDRAVTFTFLGFFFLLITVIGLIYGYWHFVYDSAKNDDYRYGISEKINQNETDTEIMRQDYSTFKNCLKSGGWRSCF